MVAGAQVIVRLISSQDHDISKSELMRSIRETGIDRYDKDREPIFNDIYGPHKVDFFGVLVESNNLDAEIVRMKNEFGTKTLGDRNKAVTPDIAIVYKASRCDMVQHVYAERLTSDCFRFRQEPTEALLEVREL